MWVMWVRPRLARDTLDAVGAVQPVTTNCAAGAVLIDLVPSATFNAGKTVSTEQVVAVSQLRTSNTRCSIFGRLCTRRTGAADTVLPSLAFHARRTSCPFCIGLAPVGAHSARTCRTKVACLAVVAGGRCGIGLSAGWTLCTEAFGSRLALSARIACCLFDIWLGA